MAFDCTNTTCPLDGGKTVWSIDLGEDYAVTGLTIQRRLRGTVYNDVVGMYLFLMLLYKMQKTKTIAYTSLLHILLH